MFTPRLVKPKMLRASGLPKRPLPSIQVPNRKFLTDLPALTPPRPLHEIVLDIKASDILAEKPPLVLSVRANDTVFHAITLMSNQNVGCVVVNDEHDKMPIGLFTERNYRERIILKDRSSKTTLVKEILDKMPKQMVVTPSFTLHECASILVTQGLRHIPVAEFIGDALDQDTRITGIISSRDILKSLSVASAYCTNVVYSDSMSAVYSCSARKHTSEFFLSPDDLVYKALELMSKHAINSVVVHDGTELLGLFTERDYLQRVFLKGKRAVNTKLGEVMSTNVVTVQPSDPFLQGLKLMVEKNIRNLPIISMEGSDISYSDRTIIGLTTEMDMIWYMLQQCCKEMKD